MGIYRISSVSLLQTILLTHLIHPHCIHLYVLLGDTSSSRTTDFLTAHSPSLGNAVFSKRLADLYCHYRHMKVSPKSYTQYSFLNVTNTYNAVCCVPPNEGFFRLIRLTCTLPNPDTKAAFRASA